MLARHTYRWCEWKEPVCEGRCGEGRRKDVEKMSADECEGNRPLALAFIAHSLFSPFLFLTRSPLFPPLSSPLLTALLLSFTLHLFLAPFPPNVFSKSHFLSHHLSAWLERLVLTVFIIPCLTSFDQEDSSQDLAAAASTLARHIPNSQELINQYKVIYFAAQFLFKVDWGE